jgi:esterase/lipase
LPFIAVVAGLESCLKPTCSNEKATVTETLFVFIHGLCGNGTQLDPLSSRIVQEGDDALPLTLPGPGGGTGSFVRTTSIQWEHAVEQRVRESLERASRVVLVGHSLGALLALSAPRKYRWQA